MPISSLSLVVFVAVFAGVVFIHEFGHFLVSRLLGVEVEEFGFGLPPRMLTMWRQRGYLLLRSGKRIEIPSNLGPPFPWSVLLNRDLRMTVDPVDDKLILRSLTFPSSLLGARRPMDPIQSTDFNVGADGRITGPADGESSGATQKIGARDGQLSLVDSITEAHPGTELTLNWLPFGGFVRPRGDNDPRVPGGLAAASPWTRLAVLFAGPTMNLLLGVVVFSLLFFQMGVPDYSQVQIGDVLSGSPASQAGIRIDDIVLTANGVAIHDSSQLHDIIYASLDKPVVFTLRRGNETVTVTATPSSARPANQGALGISMGPALVKTGSAIQSVEYGSLAVYGQIRLLILLPAQLIRGQANPQDSRFIGLKGIYDLFGQAISRDVQSRETTAASPGAGATQTPTYFTLQLIGILTISLGVLNVFPFPALDGGRILFVLPELVLRRRVPTEWENRINAVGMVLLLLFMVYVNVMDFVNPAVVNLPK